MFLYKIRCDQIRYIVIEVEVEGIIVTKTCYSRYNHCLMEDSFIKVRPISSVRSVGQSTEKLQATNKYSIVAHLSFLFFFSVRERNVEIQLNSILQNSDILFSNLSGCVPCDITIPPPSPHHRN